MLAGSSVLTNKRVYRGGTPLPRAAQSNATEFKPRPAVDPWWERENSGMPGLQQEAERQRKLEELASTAVRDRQLGRTPEQKRALEQLQELDAKTRDRVDQEFAAEQRVEQLGMTNTLTPEQYAALSPRQQAAVQFNTGLIDAGRADAETGGVDATRDYLARFNITRDEKELTSFLRLDDLVGDSILRKLDDLTARQDSASSLRWARGDEKAAGDSARFLRARGSSDAAAEAISINLSSTGNPLLSGGTPLAGFGNTDRDNVVKFAFTNMVDSRWNMTWDDVVSGLNQLNTNFGTDVSPDELWQYAGAAVGSVDFARAGNREANVYNMTTPDPEDKDFTPIDAAEIRRRYGL